MRAVSSISTGSPARDSRRNRREAGPGSVSPAGETRLGRAGFGLLPGRAPGVREEETLSAAGR